MADLNKASPEEIASLMDVLRAMRWTAADYPGGGNIPPWSVIQSNRMIPARGIATPSIYEDEQAYLARLPPEWRRDAERMLLDRDLRMSQDFIRGRKPPAGVRNMSAEGMLPGLDAASEREVSRVNGAFPAGRGMLTPPADSHQRRYPPIIGVRG